MTVHVGLNSVTSCSFIIVSKLHYVLMLAFSTI